MLLLNLRVIDGLGAVHAGVDIRVQEGRFREIGVGLVAGPDAVRDLEGLTAIPGLIDAHTHLSLNAAPDAMTAAAQHAHAYQALLTGVRAKALLYQGVTTARDVGGVGPDVIFAVRDAINAGQIPGPRIFSAGRWITATGGHGWPIGVEADGADAVRRAVREEIKAGADLIKFMASGGVIGPGMGPETSQFTEEELRLGAAEAHGAGLTMAAHAHGETSIRAAVRAGVDSVEHGTYLSEALGLEMVERGTFLVPTLAVIGAILAHAEEAGLESHTVERAQAVAETHRQTVQLAIRLGITLVAGTDMGAPFTGPEAIHDEIALLHEAGLTPMQALQSATLHAAQALHREDELGSVCAGLRADLVLLDGDPLADLAATRRIRGVLKDGEWVVEMGV